MLQRTQEEEKRLPENCTSNEYVVHVELETRDRDDNAQDLERSSSERQEHHTISTDRLRCTIKSRTRYGFEDLVSHALITSSLDPTTFQETTSKPREK